MVFQIREIGNPLNVQQTNVRMIKPYKANSYLNIINHVIYQYENKYKDLKRYVRNQLLSLKILHHVC